MTNIYNLFQFIKYKEKKHLNTSTIQPINNLTNQPINQ
jgi:hypothetical protein